MKLGILASHRGTNFQAIIDACKRAQLNASISVAISNNSASMALQRAREAGIPALHISDRHHPGAASVDGAILQALVRYDVDLVVTAGYLKKLGPRTLSHFDHRIVNIHPSLLPAYGGKGMFGPRIHQAVIDNKETETGITMHFVDAGYDTVDIISQVRIQGSAADTASSLEQKVLQQEHPFLIATLQQLRESQTASARKNGHEDSGTGQQ